MLNVASTGIYTKLALIVNFKWNACKKWASSQKSVVILSACRYTEIAQRIFKYSDRQYTSLTPDKILNSLVYRTLFYVNVYAEVSNFQKTVGFFWPTLYMRHVSRHWRWLYEPSQTDNTMCTVGHDHNICEWNKNHKILQWFESIKSNSLHWKLFKSGSLKHEIVKFYNMALYRPD